VAEETMVVDRQRFYSDYRAYLSKKIKQSQIDGYEAIFNYWDALGIRDIRWLAYILASVYHETGRTMEPVRESFAETDAEAVKRITRYIDKINQKRTVQGKRLKKELRNIKQKW
jgi:septal ring factor EnvC (AmiA/AmiB activator)